MHPLLRNIQAVIFDAVGTVIHPSPPAPAVYAEVARRFGSDLPVSVIRRRFIDAFREEEALDVSLGLRTSEQREIERWQRIVARTLGDVADPATCFDELFEHFSQPQAWQADPDALQTFEALAKLGYELGLASNYDRRLHRVAAGLPPLSLLKHVVISSEVGWRKPAREFFEILSERLGMPPNNILFVGDDFGNDYTGARDAGLQAVLIDRRDAHAEAEVVCIHRLNELLSNAPQ